MATSNSFDYSRTAAQIIQASFEDLGIVAPGATVGSNDSALALVRLNFIAKQWQGNSDMAPGLKVWSRQRIVMFLEYGQQSYLLGPSGSPLAKATLLNQFGQTTLSAAEAAAQTTISITSNTDTTSYPGTTITMANTNIVGVQLDTGAMHWSTISGTPTTTMTISDALPSGASAGNVVYWYSAAIQARPVEIESAVLRNADRTDSPLGIFKVAESYDRGVSDKFGDGNPTSILFEPLLLNSRITLDSQPTDVTEYVILTALYPAEDYDSSSNDIAFPQEWFAALEWELAFRLAPAYGSVWTPAMESNRVNALTMARSLNPRESTVFFQPGLD